MQSGTIRVRGESSPAIDDRFNPSPASLTLGDLSRWER
jgi:hypothetical protein